MTPLIDVVMCLIIFFLIMGKLATDRGVNVRLPEARSGQDETSPHTLIITIAGLAADTPRVSGWAAQGLLVQVEGKEVIDALGVEGAVRSAILSEPMTSVQVRADRELSFGSVEPVLRAAGLGGAKSVRLAAEKPS